MIEIDDKIVSADLLREYFACDLAACKGICCVEGNAGAPLEMDEVDTLEEEYPNYKPYMTPEGIRAVEAQGFMVVDEDGDYTTPLVDDAECAYAYTEEGITFCAIEKAFREGKTTFRKPHLLPSLSDPPDELLERHGRTQLPPLVDLRTGTPMRKTARDPGVQGASGADHPSLRRRVLQSARNCGTTAQESIEKQRHEMKNRHIIAAALLLLTTTTAAQDRHTETTPDTGENLQTTPNAEQLRQQIETLQRQLDLLEKGRDTLAVKKPALLSDPVEPIANMNGIIPLDTLQTINEAVKIVIYNDNSWKYVRDREFVKDSSIYTKYWDTGTLFPYKEYPLSEMPASLAIDLVDSLKCYHYPHKGSIRSKYGIRHRRRHQGVDIPIKTGDPVYATFDGRVRISEYNRGGYGNLIIVRHDNGLETYYGHLSERLVQSGEWVEAGQIIGLGGSTGRSTGPHLHFETRYYGQAFDPERLIDFESGILRRQTFLLKKSFFDIRSNAGQDFDDEAEVEKADKKEAAERAAVTYHTIKSGDTLGALARRYGTTVSKLCSLNGIKSTTILRLGRKLRVR